MCERYSDLLPLTHPQLGTRPATQACTLAGNRTGNLLVHRPALNPLSHTSQGAQIQLFKFIIFFKPSARTHYASRLRVWIHFHKESVSEMMAPYRGRKNSSQKVRSASPDSATRWTEIFTSLGPTQFLQLQKEGVVWEVP